MDYVTLFSNLFLMAAFAFGFAYGVKKGLTTRKMLYFYMITAAMGCAAVTRLYNAVVILCMGEYAGGFNVGLVGPISCFGLLFCAEFGALDSLAEKTALKHKGAVFGALAAPAVLAVCSMIIVHRHNVDIVHRIFIFFTLVAICAASYFNAKHLVLGKMGDPIFAPLMKYNALALLLETCYVLELFFMTCNLELVYLLTQGVIFAVAICILPALDKGVAKWTT